MQQISKRDLMCLVCGGPIIKGESVIRFAPQIPGSARHEECFGKPDKFKPHNGTVTSAAPPPDTNAEIAAVMAQIKQANDEAAMEDMAATAEMDAAVVNAQCAAGGESTESSGGEGNDEDWGPEPGEAKPGEKPGEAESTPFDGEANSPDSVPDDLDEIDNLLEEDNEEPAKQEPVPEQPKPEDDDMLKTPAPPAPPPAAPNPNDAFAAMIQAMAPMVKKAVSDQLLPELAEKINKIMTEVQKQAVNPATAKLDEQVKFAEAATKKLEKISNGFDKQLADAIAKAAAASTGKAIVDLTVQLPDGTEHTSEGLHHYLTPKLLKLMQRRRNIYLPGPAGSGKSTAARKAAAILGLPFYYVSLNPMASPTRIEGYQTPHGEYVMTLFRRAYEFGGVFCADEVDNSSPNLWTSVNNAIDSDLGSFPDGMVQRHKDFVFVGTGNTNLNGDAIYRDRKALDKATISRFVFLQWDYDTAMESKIALSINPKAHQWVVWVQNVRAFAQTNNPQLYAYATPRASYDGAMLLGDGFTSGETADMVLFKHTFDATAVKAVFGKVPLPNSSMLFPKTEPKAAVAA
jgi:cobaltochelatase CobS